MIEINLSIVRQRIRVAAERSGRRFEDVQLVCVTKEATPDAVKEAIRCGVTDIGENRLQDAVEKYDDLGVWASGHLGNPVSQFPSFPDAQMPRSPLKWHFIGHLQTNKVKKAVEIFDLIHSVDSFRLCEAISREAAKINKTQDILIQVNTSGEKSKFGIEPKQTLDLIERLAQLNSVRVLGLMTIAPLVDDSEMARPCFRKLKQLSEELKNFFPQPVLSMGMSGDYEVAIQEGSTMVRIGRAIFKN
jgi:pyridoxal phosphate enzyme (YggS family)